MATRIDQLVKQTGLTSRALRYYEARGLLAPLRTASGRRIYDSGDLERIHQIVTLKRAGLSLTQIGKIISNKPPDMEKLLQGQLANLSAQAAEIAEARANLESALSRIRSGEPLDAATLCSLIKDGDKTVIKENWMKLIDRFYTPEEQAHWLENAAPVLPEFQSDEYNDQWRKLSARIEAAMPMKPDSEEALCFVREWFTLLEPFSKIATPEMWQGASKMYEAMPEWEGDFDASFSSSVWQFIMEATKSARSAGHDIGPIPEWM